MGIANRLQLALVLLGLLAAVPVQAESAFRPGGMGRTTPTERLMAKKKPAVTLEKWADEPSRPDPAEAAAAAARRSSAAPAPAAAPGPGAAPAAGGPASGVATGRGLR